MAKEPTYHPDRSRKRVFCFPPRSSPMFFLNHPFLPDGPSFCASRFPAHFSTLLTLPPPTGSPRPPRGYSSHPFCPCFYLSLIFSPLSSRASSNGTRYLFAWLFPFFSVSFSPPGIPSCRARCVSPTSPSECTPPPVILRQRFSCLFLIRFFSLVPRSFFPILSFSAGFSPSGFRLFSPLTEASFLLPRPCDGRVYKSSFLCGDILCEFSSL